MDAGTVELVQLDTQLDFDHAPECCWDPCSADATWMEVNECCRADFYFCDSCRTRAIKYMARPGSYICNSCDARDAPYHWEPIR